MSNESLVVVQNGGSTLCVVDDSNDHVLSVWDWQREERLAEVKVRVQRSSVEIWVYIHHCLDTITYNCLKYCSNFPVC